MHVKNFSQVARGLSYAGCSLIKKRNFSTQKGLENEIQNPKTGEIKYGNALKRFIKTSEPYGPVVVILGGIFASTMYLTSIFHSLRNDVLQQNESFKNAIEKDIKLSDNKLEKDSEVSGNKLEKNSKLSKYEFKKCSEPSKSELKKEVELLKARVKDINENQLNWINQQNLRIDYMYSTITEAFLNCTYTERGQQSKFTNSEIDAKFSEIEKKINFLKQKYKIN